MDNSTVAEPARFIYKVVFPAHPGICGGATSGVHSCSRESWTVDGLAGVVGIKGRFVRIAAVFAGD